MKRFLHAACGDGDKSRTTREFHLGEWDEVRMDASLDNSPDIISTLADMSTIENGAFDAVFTSHSLERLYPHEVGTALRNFHRVLADDGYMIIAAADLQSACALVAEDKLLEPAYESAAGPVSPMDIIYGFRPAIASGLEHFACKCGFTSRVLAGTIAQIGFGSLWSARNPSTFSLVCIATKQEVSEEALKTLADKHFGS